ncbi:MAG: Sua5/YciO/YrdC/YwlC family protein, partial [Eggerthellaceae bacterium]|nr:Sua5/YciO/YrdC/YwlC family protein [Eggerthellaceae bacterium]
MAKVSERQRVLAALRAGNPVIIPTDTVYGLAISTRSSQAPDILYEIKNRDERKPIIWLIGDRKDLERYGKDVPQYAKNLA